MGEAIVAAATSFHRTWLAKLVLQALLVAVPVGIGFGLAMGIVRQINAERFDAILNNMTPAEFGWRVVLLRFVFQVAAGAVSRSRR